MKVYRLLSEKELKLIKNGETQKLGHIFFGAGASNNHKYKDGVRYIHFFKNKHSINYIKGERMAMDNSPHYICEFDIPFFTLLGCMGKGEYLELDSYEYIGFIEYALEADKFNPNWLKSITKVDNKYVDIER